MAPNKTIEQGPRKIEQEPSTMTGLVQSRKMAPNMKIEQEQRMKIEVRNIQTIRSRRRLMELERRIPWTVQSRIGMVQRMKTMVQSSLLRSWIRRSSCPSACRQSPRQRWPGFPHDRCCSPRSTRHCRTGLLLRRSRPRRNTKQRRRRNGRTSFCNFLVELLMRN